MEPPLHDLWSTGDQPLTRQRHPFAYLLPERCVGDGNALIHRADKSRLAALPTLG
jgi:hypothetical protein